ncbi:hypothetical protein FRB91_007673 [Serendipita sp. 411]|nr:hypothetical protein FRC19_010327 [Serendipita sp. 401]KAG8859487.1 hypothetical protein FRB91_007673 [Serendipita sp. 411]KAG9057822.1 hypothetical protein FS842_003897 [Serendipita sp. 407]
MPREVTLHHGIIPSAEAQPLDDPAREDNLESDEDPFETSHSSRPPPFEGRKTSENRNAGALMRKYDPSEVIDITSSSSEDEATVSASPLKNRDAHLHKNPISQSSSGLNPSSTSSSLMNPHSPTKAKRRYVIYSSSDEDEEPIRSQIDKKGKEAIKRNLGETSTTVPFVFPIAGDIKVGDDGLIEYVPTPRNPRSLSPSKQQTTRPNPSLVKGLQISERRRTALQPDVVPEYVEDISWEVEKTDTGGIRTQATVVRRKSNVHAATSEPSVPLVEPADEEVEEVSELRASPSKTPRRKKMPEAVANLHRIAIPYLKQLDAKVFDNQLGARHLPELEQPPASPTKKKRGDQTGVIYGMSSRGEFNDGNGSYLELVWSNRMATTAGRTDYKKTSQRQITIKIELGVKVVTTEERLRNTLAHEACHAATWAINGDFSKPHGATFKSWAMKVMRAFPGVEVTTRHDYEIQYKFSWKCTKLSCGQIYQRHSNSIDTEKHGCHCGSRLEPQFSLPQKRNRSDKADGSPTKSVSVNPKVPVDAMNIAARDAEIELSDDPGQEAVNSLVDNLVFELKRTVI